MKLSFFGAARTVTGSMHLLEINGRRLLLDCGLYQGRRKDAYEVNKRLPFDPATIDAVILSHAHIDHSGNLPTLVKNGFRGSIYTTSASRDLAAILLLDSAHIQETDVEYVNRRRRSEHRQPFEPLYVKADALAAMESFVTVDYRHPFEPLPGVKARFLDAGHMLGSAVVVLELTEGEKTGRLVFSGDIGRKGMAILRDPQVPDGADWLIMESTYGDRSHEGTDVAKGKLAELAQHAFDRGGKVLIPAFAVGRTQEIIYRLNQLWNDGKLPPIPVFVDSPLAINATEIFRVHPECFDAEMLDARIREPDGDPLQFPRLRFLRSVEDSKRLNTMPGPAIIISASGMCESGRILHHLKNYLEEGRNAILFVGYQAEHTLGRKLLDHAEEVSVLGERRRVRAKIHRIESYSAHADRNELLTWVRGVARTRMPRQVFLVHGEQSATASLKESLLAEGCPSVDVPFKGQVVELT